MAEYRATNSELKKYYDDLLQIIWDKDLHEIYHKESKRMLSVKDWVSFQDPKKLIKANSWWLEHINQTYDLCLIAIQKNCDLLYYINREFRTHQLIITAIKNKGDVIDALDVEELTKELCIDAIRIWNYTFDIIMWKYRNKYLAINNEIIIEALKINGCLLEFLLPEEITERHCEIAINQNGMSYLYIPQKYRTNEIKMNAIRRSKYAIEFFEYPITKEMLILHLETHKYYNKLTMNIKKYNFEIDREFIEKYESILR